MGLLRKTRDRCREMEWKKKVDLYQGIGEWREERVVASCLLATMTG